MSSVHSPTRLQHSSAYTFEGVHDASMQPAELTLFVWSDADEHQALCAALSRLSREARDAGLDGEWRERLHGQVRRPDGSFIPLQSARPSVVFYASGHARIDVEVTLPSGATVQNIAWRGDIAQFKEMPGQPKHATAPEVDEPEDEADFRRMFPLDLERKAVAEGWTIFDCDGSEYDRWQVQAFADASDAERAYEVPNVPQLDNDDVAMQILGQGNETHHVAARAFLKKHSPREYAAVMKYATRPLLRVVPQNDSPSPM